MERENRKGEAAGAVEIEEDTAIADAIYAGLTDIAGAIRELARAMSGEEGEPVEPETYLDGTRIR